jgi:tetratricopeptide (TPR) repeat protein
MKYIFLKIFIICGLWTAVCGLSLSDAQKDYLYGNYDEALSKAKSLRPTDESLYFLGLVYTKTGDYLKAREYFRKLTHNFPDSRLYAQGLVKLADTYFFQKDYDNAQALYLEIRKRYPDLNTMPVVLLRLAQVSSKKGDWQAKKNYLQLISQKYPGCAEMQYVKEIESYGDFFTIQIGAFSDKKNALYLAQALKEKYNVYVIEDKKQDYTIYKVRVGKYKNRYDAQQTAIDLVNEGYPARIYP